MSPQKQAPRSKKQSQARSDQNLAQCVFDFANSTPNQIALITPEETITYQQLKAKIQLLALYFKQKNTTQPVGLLLENTPSFVVSYFALLTLGIPVIPLNIRLSAEELSVILSDAGAEYLISSDSFTDTLIQLKCPKLKTILFEGQEADFRWLKLKNHQCQWQRYEHCIASKNKKTKEKNLAASQEINPIKTDRKTLATLIYTSGTTGKPKGVMLSHHNILSDILGNVEVIEAQKQDRFITISPLFHVFGQTNVLLTAMAVGASVVLVKKFSPTAILEAIEIHQVTFMAAVPTMYQMMLNILREKSYKLNSLRVCHSGAAPMSKETFSQIEKIFGAPVQEGYGLSEASSIVTSNPLKGIRKPGSVGLAIPGVQLQVVDESIKPVPANTIGELLVHGDTVMLGYFNNPEATQKMLLTLDDGKQWLKTGDLCFMDEDGYIHIVDRRDDLMNIGGTKVYPREIEEVLYRHPAVESCAVVGVYSKLYNHKIKAWIVLSPDWQKKAKASITKEIKLFCQKHLGKFKIPKEFAYVEEIPKGASGKILRKELRQ